MMMFIMGLLLGSGLVLLVEELQFQNWLRHESKPKQTQDVETTECTCTEVSDWGHAYYCEKS